LLAGGTSTLAEIAELAYGSYTPATAWAAWLLVADGLLFRGTPQQVVARTQQEVAQEKRVRQAQADEAQAWSEFLASAQAGHVMPEDRRYLREVEDLALGRRNRSRLLHEMKRGETRENAHALLLELGHWDESANPYPARLGVVTEPVQVDVPALPAESRQDLTAIPAFAIDDEGNEEPDDAISMEGDRLWVHVADAASLAPPGSPLDLEARARGATLYLPEGPVPMLPAAAIGMLGLGLTEVSPALSFSLDLDANARIRRLQVMPSWVRVTRLTYEEAESRLAEQPFASLYELAQAHRERRRDQGAISIDLPEVEIRVQDRQVTIRPLASLRSRDVVMEAMLMVGEAVARFGLEHGVALPFTTQESPVDDRAANAQACERSQDDLAGMYAVRQTLRPSQYSTAHATHAGLGLAAYVQATSPLRRYLDLVTHQQLRSFVAGCGQLSAQDLTDRVGATMAFAGAVRAAERLARRHWTLVFLMQNPNWRGEGILVERRGHRGIALIPSLDLDTVVHLPHDLALNHRLRLSHPRVNLPLLEARFEVAE
jgi:exoribonuclease-2